MCDLLKHFFLKARRGVVAIEFALVTPFLILVFLGITELTFLMQADRKMATIAYTIGDLVAQDDFIGDDELDDIKAAANVIASTHAGSALKYRVTSVYRPAAQEYNKPLVAWSETENMTPFDEGDTFHEALTELVAAGTSLIVIELEYIYSPFFGTELLKNAITLRKKYYLRPRRSTFVNREGFTALT